MLFEEIKIKNSNIPIVLIDNSGSTHSFVLKSKHDETNVLLYSEINPDNVNLSILNLEVRIAKKYFESICVEQIYLMTWNSKAEIVSNDPINVSDMLSYNYDSNGGTYIEPALTSIPNHWFNSVDQTEPIKPPGIYLIKIIIF
jgi:hypothetical protein